MVKPYSKQKPSIIQIVTTGKGYHDLCELFSSLDPFFEKQIILSKEKIHFSGNLKNTFNICMDNEKFPFGNFWIWSSIKTKNIIKHNKDIKWFVVEHFNGIAIFILKKLYRIKSFLLLSLYNENLRYLFKRVWQKDLYSGKVSLKQNLFYYKRWMFFCIVDLIGAFGADGFLGNAPNVFTFQKLFFKNKPTFLLPNPISENRNKIFFSNKKYGIKKIIYVGVMQPSKGLGMIFKAVDTLSKMGYLIELQLAGRVYDVDKPWFFNLLEEYSQKINVEYEGLKTTSELRQLYESADLLVFPSFSEGSPRVVQEALNFYCPVVASDLPGIRFIDPSGKIIKFFPCGDLQKMVAAVECALGEINNIKSNILASAFMEKFQPEILAQEFMTILNMIERK